MKIKSILKILLLAMIVVSFSSVRAEMDQSLVVGGEIVDLNAPAARFEEYHTVPRGFFFENYSFLQKTPLLSLKFTADKILRSDQSYDLAFNGPFNLRLNYDQIPHNLSYNSRLVFTRTGEGAYSLPDDLQTYLQNNPGNYTTSIIDYAATAEGFRLATRRDRLTAKIDLGFGLSLEQEKKSGTKPIGASLGFNQADELPEPINFTTTNLILHKAMEVKGIEIDANYKYSNFQNATTALVWDNPRRITDTTSSDAYTNGTGSVTGRLNLPPNNLAQEATLNLGSALPMNGRLVASVGYDIATQKDALLPYTTNTAIISGAANSPPFDASQAANLPAANVDARVDTLAERVLMNFNPNQNTTLAIGFRSAKVDNKSTSLSFPGQVRLDQVWESGTEETGDHFWDNKKDNYDLDLTFNLPRGWLFGAGYGLEAIGLAHREVSNLKENVLRASLRGNLSSRISFKGSFLTGARRMDDFDVTAYQDENGVFEEHPGLRRSDVADRNRQEYNLGLNFFPKETMILGLNYRNGAADYLPGKGDLTGGQAGFADEMYGLISQRNDDLGINADLWLLDESLELYTYYDRSSVRYFDRSNLTAGSVTQKSANDWTANTIDTYDTIGLDIDRYLADDRIIAGFSLLYSAGHGKIDLSDVLSTAAVEQSPPDTSTILREISAKLEYKVRQDLSLNTSLTYEQFDGDDWAINNVPLIPGKTAAGAPSPNGIFLGNSLVNYKGLVAKVTGKYSF